MIVCRSLQKENKLYDKFLQVILEDSNKFGLDFLKSDLDPTSRADLAMQQIKEYILDNHLRAGDALPTEAQLCISLNLSRTAVREALRRLEALDIVKSFQGKGTFVSEISLRPLVESLILRATITNADSRITLQEIVRIRQALDQGNGLSLAKALVGKNIDNLQKLVDAMVSKADTGQTFLEEDIAFHSSLLRYLDNPLLVQLNEAMWMVHMAIVPKLQNVSRKGLITSAKSHGEMLNALVEGDVVAYDMAVRNHYAPLAGRIEDNHQN